MKIPDLLAQVQIPVIQTPRVNPQYAAEGGVTRAGEVIGGRIEGAGLIDAGGPTRQALFGAGRTLEDIGAREMALQAAMTKYANRMKATSLAVEGAQQFDDAVQATINDPRLDHGTFVPTIEGRMTEIRRSLLEKAPSDEVRAELGPMLDRLYLPNRHKVQEFSFKHFNSSIRAGIDDAIQNTARMAANEPDRNLALFYEEAIQRLITSVGPATFTPEEVRKKVEEYKTTVAGSEMDKMIQDNPGAVVEHGADLFASRLPPGQFDAKMARAQGRADALASRAVTEQNRARIELDRTLARQAEQIERTIISKLNAKDADTGPYLESVREFLTSEKGEHFDKLIRDQAVQGGPGDPRVIREFAKRVYDVNAAPATTARDLARAFDAGLVPEHRYTPWAAHLQSLIEKDRTENRTPEKTYIERRHRDVTELIKQSIRTQPGLSMKLDYEAEEVTTQALEDLARNSSYFREKGEDPFDWWNRRRAFYVGRIADRAQGRVQELQRSLLYPDAKALMQNVGQFKGGQTDPDFLDQVRYFKEIKGLTREMERYKTLQKAPVGADATNPRGRE